ncbi:MAG: archaemetzincin [Candidatus Promineifilaceae bacterium]|nr:archaemetzincin [Candidatus Promineifilaceae bacterium]
MTSFLPPEREQRLQAIGPVDDLPASLRRAFTPADNFDPIPPPSPSDWLANHPEPGQSFQEWLAARPLWPDSRRQTIYLQPLEDFTGETAPALDQLLRFAEAFFALPVAVLAPLGKETASITSRINPYTKQKQLLTTEILTLLRRRLPADAFCLLGITLHDLYPDPTWNFVFGQASLRERVGVYSFARYLPTVAEKRQGTDAAGDVLILRRSCKVLAHEAGHMFGIRHCIWYHCLMNGSNHLEESDSRPLHLCPVDLRKLHRSVGFDPAARYRRLQQFWRAAGAAAEAKWLDERLSYLS